MNDYKKDMERTQRRLQECDIPSEPEDDSEGESDSVEEGGAVPHSDCHETDCDDLRDETHKKVSRCGRWFVRDKNTW